MGLINDLIRTVLGQSLGLGFDLLGQSLQQRQLNKQGVQTGQAVQSLLQPQPDIAGAAAQGRTPAAFTPFGDQPPSPLTNISDKLPQFPADQLGLILQDPQAMELIMNQLTQQQKPFETFQSALGTAGGRELFETLSPNEFRAITQGGDFPIGTSQERTATLEGGITGAKEDILQPNRIELKRIEGEEKRLTKRTAGARAGGGGKPKTLTPGQALQLDKAATQATIDSMVNQGIITADPLIEGEDAIRRKALAHPEFQNLKSFHRQQLKTISQGEEPEPLPPLQTPDPAEQLNANEQATLNQARSKGGKAQQISWLKKNQERLEAGGVNVSKVLKALQQ